MIYDKITTVDTEGTLVVWKKKEQYFRCRNGK
jgi:hypothetical protein